MNLSQGFGSESRVLELARLVNVHDQLITVLAIAIAVLAGIVGGLAVLVILNHRRVTRLELIGPSLSDRISREPTELPRSGRQ